MKYKTFENNKLIDSVNSKLSLTPDKAEEYFLEYGTASLSSGDLIRAKSDFNIVLRINPHNEIAKKRIIEIDEIINSIGKPKSLREAKRALISYYIRKSDKLYSQMNAKGSVDQIKKAFQVDPNEAEIQYKLLTTNTQKATLNKSLNEYKKVLDVSSRIDDRRKLSSQKIRAFSFLDDIENNLKNYKPFTSTNILFSLEDLYIPAQVVIKGTFLNDNEPTLEYKEVDQRYKHNFGRTAIPSLYRVNWEDIKKVANRIIIFADPGMGKSTLLRMEATLIAKQEKIKLINNQKGINDIYFPIFLQCRDLANTDIEIHHIIIELLKRDYPNSTSAIKTLLIKKLKTGKCILLFDGIDEVPIKLQANLFHKLNRFCTNYPCKIICTSRNFGYGGNFINGATEIEILPFNDQQIEYYVTRWDDLIRKKESKKSSAKLMSLIKSKLQLVDLMRNPLLLSLFCSLYEDESFPESIRTGDIYKIIINYLFNWGERRECISRHRAFVKLRLLEELAYDFSANNKEIFTVSELCDWINQYTIKAIVPNRILQLSVPEIAKELMDTGIFISMDCNEDKLTFFHRTIREFLTASYISKHIERNQNIQLARQYYRDVNYHQVLVMTTGQMYEPLLLIKDIVTQKDDIFKSLLLLAGRCIVECNNISNPIISKTISKIFRLWKDKLFAPITIPVVTEICKVHSKMTMNVIRALKGRNNEIKYRAIQILEKINTEIVIGPLIGVLTDKNSEVRQRAAAALGNIGSEKAIESLIKALGDESENIRYSAAEALGRIGSERAIEPLIKALGDESENIRYSAAEALGRIGSERAIESLIKALGDKSENIRYSAAETLGRIGSERAIEPLIKALGDESENIRYSAAETLGRIGSERAVEPLIKALGDKSENIKYSAAEALGRIGSERAIEPLIKLIDNKSENINSQAVEALGRIGSERVIVKNDWKTLINDLSHQDTNIKIQTIKALEKIGTEKAIELLTKLLHDVNESVRYEAVNALGNIPDQGVIGALIAALNDTDYMVRSSAVRALGNIGTPEAKNSLVGALNDKHRDVRYVAAQILGNLGISESIKVLVESLNDHNYNLRYMAALSLGNIDALDTSKILINILNDENSLVKRAAAQALVKIGSINTLENLIQNTSIDIFDPDIFMLARTLSLKYNKSRSPFIPLYPELIKKYKPNQPMP